MKVERHNGIVTVNHNHMFWIHASAPSDPVLKNLSKEYDIPLSVLRDALDEEEKPRVYPVDHNMVVVFKVPLEVKGGSITTSTAVFLTKKGIVSIAVKKVELFDNLFKKQELLEEMFKKNNIILLHYLLDKINSEFFKHLDLLEDNLDAAEKTMFTTANKQTMKRLYRIKKTLIYFHKSVSNNREVASSLEKGQNLSSTESKLFRMLYNDILQMLDMIGLYREIVTSNMEIYLTIANNNLSHVMKRLTAGATLVMVPTFITGLYGMNFRFLPEVTWKYGYLFAWFLILASFAALWIYFKKKDYL